jgi:hypothetical protein
MLWGQSRNGMEPNSFGKKLGIGVRVAGNIARERAAEAARRAGARPRVEVPPRPVTEMHTELKQRGRTMGQGLGRGAKSFGRSFFGPLAHAGSVLWLEITGCFFALFAAFFAQNVYHLRGQYVVGEQHQKFVLYVVLTILFLYFSASSFIRARRKAAKQRAGR